MSMHPSFQRIFSLFTNRFGLDIGKARFDEFIKNNKLNPLKEYRPEIQFKESFEWVEPLIVPYKQDHEAKYYLVRALTANVSMNNKDYAPGMDEAASTLSWRPINLDHNHESWLPYPRNRVDFATSNELSVEATMRIDNKEAYVQKMLDEGKIKHPSIEGRPSPAGGYHFMGMALLTIGESIPGDPLTEIIPLAFNESVGRQICEVKSGKLVCECQNESVVKNTMTEKENLSELTKELDSMKKDEEINALKAELDLIKTKGCEESKIKDDEVALAKAKMEQDIKNKEAQIASQKESYDKQITSLKESIRKQSLEGLEKLEKVTRDKYLLEGKTSEQKITIDAQNEKLGNHNNEFMEQMKIVDSLKRRLEEKSTELTEALKLAESIKLQRDNIHTQNQVTIKENLLYIEQLTKVNKELIEEKKAKTTASSEVQQYKESVDKARKKIKWLEDDLRRAGKIIISPAP